MSTSNDSPLFQPYKLGDIGTLNHRVVLAPLTRVRNDEDFAPRDMAVKYYAQRASTPRTLLFTEGTVVGPQAYGIKGTPGIWTDRQVEAWKKVTDAIHARRSCIVAQLWSTGPAADPVVLAKLGQPYTNASAWHSNPAAQLPREMTVAEIREHAALYATAARNAIERAGFDGVELHLGNGYLMDNFLQTVSNKRTDAYGGSVENWIRFPLEALAAIVETVGQTRVGVFVSPFALYQGMRMPEADIVETFSTLLTRIRDTYPQLAFVHVRKDLGGGTDLATSERYANDSDDFLHAIWKAGNDADKRAYIVGGGFDRGSALERAKAGDLVAFGRAFLANPDLPRRLQHDWPLTQGNRATYYTSEEVGYTDYPFYEVSE